MIRTFSLSFLLIISTFSFAQQEKQFSLYLIGDAGEHTDPHEALLALRTELNADEKSAVVFLGDNVYPAGLNLNDKNSILRMRSQLDMLKEYKGQAYFIPGNHDWAAQKPSGLSVLHDQQVFVDSFLQNNSSIKNKTEGAFFPKNGLPGPSSVIIAPGIRLIMIDTQWFLQAYNKNKKGTIKNTKEFFYKELDSLLLFSKKNNEQVVIAAHHPVFTNGEHSRKAQPVRFLINYVPPFQLFGLAGLYRLYSQDIDHRKYKKMREQLLDLFRKYDNIYYVSGHDHNLQFIVNENDKYIVSGAGSKLSKIKKKKRFESKWQDDQSTGFVRLDFMSDGSINVHISRAIEPKVVELKGF